MELIRIYGDTRISQFCQICAWKGTNAFNICLLLLKSWNQAHVALVLHPACFTPLRFNPFCQYTPLLNLQPIIFGLRPFGWLPSITLTCTNSCSFMGTLFLIYDQFFRTQIGFNKRCWKYEVGIHKYNRSRNTLQTLWGKIILQKKINYGMWRNWNSYRDSHRTFSARFWTRIC